MGWHRDGPETQGCESHQRPLEPAGHRRYGKGSSRQPFSCRLQREISHRRGYRVKRCLARQHTRRRVGQPLRQKIGNAEDQNRAECEGLRRFVIKPEGNAKNRANGRIDCEREDKGAAHRGAIGDRNRAWPPDRGDLFDCTTRSKEGVCLVEGMYDDMQKREWE